MEAKNKVIIVRFEFNADEWARIKAAGYTATTLRQFLQGEAEGQIECIVAERHGEVDPHSHGFLSK